MKGGTKIRTLKFLFLTSYYPPYHLGGDATHVKYLAEELANKGHEVHILHSLDAYRIKRKNFDVLEQEPDKKNIFIHRIKSPLNQMDPLMAYTLGFSFYVQKKFLEVIKEVDPNVVHHHNISLLGYSILEKKDNYLSLYTAHDYWLICQTNNLLRNKRKICVHKNCYSCAVICKRIPQIWRQFKGFEKAIKNIDLMISPSDFVRTRILKEIELKSCTIPNFAPQPPNNIDPSVFLNYFLFVGMLEPHKGILHLLAMFNELRSDLKTKLIVVGGGSLDAYVKAYISKNSLAEKVIFLGFVTQEILYSLYSNALALIVPSIWPENAPLVVLEALSVGTPVIVSNRGGLPEIVSKIDKSLIFTDFVDLRNVLLSFDKSAFNSSKVKKIFQDNYSAESYVNKYLKIVNSSRNC